MISRCFWFAFILDGAGEMRTIAVCIRRIFTISGTQSVYAVKGDSAMNANWYTDDMKTITTNLFSFRLFRENDDILYIDKTMYAYILAKETTKNFFFLSRPRRFGKSLFCSTLHSLFEGDEKLFKGLYIAEKTDYDFKPYPVLHFDFSGMDTRNIEEFLSAFRHLIKYEASRNNVMLDDAAPAQMLDTLIKKLSDEKGPVVILIDEFDSPLTAMPKISDEIRQVLNPFYATVKKNSERIRFFFITGVVKLANLSLFSSLNNLTDISMLPEFASGFGYTEEELMEYFGEEIGEYLEEYRCEQKEDFIRKIKDYYDGYRFSPDAEIYVYNPVSIGSFFNNRCRFRNYWNHTGVPAFAVSLARKCNLLELIDGESLFINEAAFYTFDISDITSTSLSRSSVIALLYYAGYLTFIDENSVDYPNTEVRISFMENLVSRYADGGVDKAFMGIWINGFRKACENGDEEAVRKHMEKYFNAFSYELGYGEKERFYHIIFHAVFIIAGLYANSEDRGLRGRSDEAVIAGEHIWVFELKVDRSVDEALKQIEEKGYGEKYAYTGKKIHRIGISFSSETRTIAQWKSLS